MRNIYLVGFMGTGKTSTGRELARILKYKFADLDELIELKEKMGIPDIFARKGEPYFRCLEKQVLKEVSAQEHFVVACGGGTVTNVENVRVMKEGGTVVCLTASVDTILSRVKGCTHRPLLQVEDPRSEVERLLKLREPFYANSDRMVDTDGLSPREAAERIDAVLREK